jgi:predicted nuclease with TOPRIM domain
VLKGVESTSMNEQLRNRLAELKREFELGQAKLRDLEAQEANLRETMLRISGAIQVLEEVLAEGSSESETETPDSAPLIPVQRP